MTMTLDQHAVIDTADADVTDYWLRMTEIAAMLVKQGFEVRQPGDPDSQRLVITNAPQGQCELDVCDSGLVTCEYYLWAGASANPADVTRAVLRLLAVPLAALASVAPDPHPGITLKGAVGCAARALGLEVEMQVSVDHVDLSVYADVVITNPAHPGRGSVCVTDEGIIVWECDVNELNRHARELVMTLTDMLAPPISRDAARTE